MKKLLFILLIFCSSLTFGQTKNIVPNSSHTGYLGTSAHSLYWAGVYTDAVNGISPTSWRLKSDHDSLIFLKERKYQSLTDTITWGLGLVQSGHITKLDTANASVLSRQRAVKEYLGKYATATNSSLLENHAANYFEPALGNPATTGYVLSSTDAGVRSWVAQGGGGSMTYPSGSGIAIVSLGTSWGTTITDNSTNWNTAYDDRLKWDGGSTGLTATTGRTSLGGTTVGQSFFTLANPSSITFPRINVDNTITALSASDARTALGAQATLTNPITGTGTTNELAYWASSSTQGTLAVATYPSLTELAYVKGVTSSIQTQIGNKSNTASPTFTGTVTLPTVILGETSLQLDPTLSASGTWSGITETGTAGATLAFGNVCYFDGATSKWKLAKADVVATCAGLLGMCVLAANTDAATEMLLIGKIRFSSFPTLAVGAPNYVSAATAGAIVAGAIGATTGQPSSTDNVIRVIGHSKTADVLYFNPSPDYITHN